jgi:hypothetical protein
MNQPEHRLPTAVADLVFILLITLLPLVAHSTPVVLVDPKAPNAAKKHDAPTKADVILSLRLDEGGMPQATACLTANCAVGKRTPVILPNAADAEASVGAWLAAIRDVSATVGAHPPVVALDVGATVPMRNIFPLVQALDRATRPPQNVPLLISWAGAIDGR